MSSGGSRCSSGVGAASSAHRRDQRCLIAPLSVADVYDIAADIGNEFEVLIDSHGPDVVVQLMQKVISALEHLERFAAEADGERDTIDALRTTITHLEHDETKRNEERSRNALEMEQIEEHYKQETRDLLSTVKRLQDENRKLSSSLAAATERDSAFSEDESYFEVDLVNRLQSVIEKQRGQIKKLDQSVLDYKTENEELTVRNDKLMSCTKDLRRKCRTVQNQLHEMVDERAELTAKLHDSHRDAQALTRQLGSAEREREDLAANAAGGEGGGGTGLKSMEGKIVYSESDPNRPRFTLAELKDILQERNSLKARVSDLEDELAVFRPSQNISSFVNSPRHGYKVRLSGPANCDCSYHSKGCRGGGGSGSIESDDIAIAVAKEAGEGDKHEDEDVEDEDDLPVQGPLPEDPEDAPWRRQESGIRKLFRRVFGHSTTGGSLRTSVSTPVALCHSDSESSPSSHNLKKSFSRFSFMSSTQPQQPEEEDESNECGTNETVDAKHIPAKDA